MKTRYTILKVVLWDEVEKKEVEITNPYFEVEGETVGYKGYKEPAKAFLHHNGHSIRLD